MIANLRRVLLALALFFSSSTLLLAEPNEPSRRESIGAPATPILKAGPKLMIGGGVMPVSENRSGINHDTNCHFMRSFFWCAPRTGHTADPLP